MMVTHKCPSAYHDDEIELYGRCGTCGTFANRCESASRGAETSD